MEIAKLEKEKRIEIKKLKELSWKRKREEYALKKVAKDWIVEKVIPSVLEIGGQVVERT